MEEIPTDFSLAGAQRWAAAGQIEAWVHAYLGQQPWANAPLSEGLKRQPRYWVGPTAVRLDNMDRTTGPEPGMRYRQSPKGWEEHVEAIREALDPDTLPPLMGYTNDGRHRNADGTFRFLLADGNHRHEALVRYGETHAQALLWFESEADRKAFLKERT